MSWFYSAVTRGFYLDEVHGENIPPDARHVPDADYAALFEAQSRGMEITPDPNGYPVATAPVIPWSTRLTNKRTQIDGWRTTALAAGMSWTFADAPTTDVVQLRNADDKANINALVTTALILQSQNITAPVIDFQGLSNTTHVLTPAQAIAMGMAATQWASGLYAHAWALKARCDTALSSADLDLIVW